MLAQRRDHSEPAHDSQLALARWDGEGGAGPDGPQDRSSHGALQVLGTPSVDAEMTRLRARVIALENLTIALLADASDDKLQRIRSMAALITPHPGATRHTVTIQAAGHMYSLVDRACHFRDIEREAKN